ncbi:NADH dehydrogenase (ubiquinone) 1 alpha subcomplex assembly factor 5 [uncultured Alphaproteobacteria bacterium]|jgi:SAM-dependent methyltransferase|uniref:NADH dehydrogenase (Ubiquinone) 1 alpha subcomplex assembly factor 5 n=1 Tax=uncultured Alphaproteobacteria bacterium TaxID=91750 RepID=A0A212IXB5_9PROT|nr:NADH dehydrogenase (ubiquinone) 1 alpha subcomplex assembly factor 5 [uncultured Alphaproteobacteria bacterium]
MQTSPLFDRSTLRARHDRAARRGDPDCLFLLREAAADLADRVRDVKGGFPLAVDLGARGPTLAAALADEPRIGTLVSLAPSAAVAALCPAPVLVADEERLPLADASADLVLSCLALHWVEDLPGALAEVLRILKPGGVFLAVLPGEETLRELRDSMARAELEVEGGVSPRVAPMLTIKDGGALLQRAGFAEPVADRDRISVDYADPLKLIADLRAMGESNALHQRRRAPMRRDTLAAALRAYRDNWSLEDGRVAATFDFVTLTAWKPLDR